MCEYDHVFKYDIEYGELKDILISDGYSEVAHHDYTPIMFKFKKYTSHAIECLRKYLLPTESIVSVMVCTSCGEIELIRWCIIDEVKQNLVMENVEVLREKLKPINTGQP